MKEYSTRRKNSEQNAKKHGEEQIRDSKKTWRSQKHKHIITII